MLIPCPECGRQVSDRARACPGCGFPVAEHLAETRAEQDRIDRLASRERVGEVDCPHCDARGFRTWEEKDEDGEKRSVFSWCAHCEHSGRVPQCRDSAGYYAVSYSTLEAFLAGAISEEAEGVVALGPEQVADYRYAEGGERWSEVSEAKTDEPKTSETESPEAEAGEAERSEAGSDDSESSDPPKSESPESESKSSET